MAQCSGLHHDLLQRKAGAWCDVPTLLAAQELGFSVTEAFLLEAAAIGELSALKFLHTEQGVPLPADISQFAAANDRMDVLRWLQELDFAFAEDTTTAAVPGGHAAILQWLLEQGSPPDEVDLCDTAAYCGRLNILAFLQEQGLLPARQELSDSLQIAGAQGHLAIALWLRQRGAEWPAILKYDDIPWQGEVLEWARAEGCTAPTETDEDDDVDH
jgi:hypothetical protein